MHHKAYTMKHAINTKSPMTKRLATKSPMIRHHMMKRRDFGMLRALVLFAPLLFIAFALLSGCASSAKTPHYITDSKRFSSMGIDRHDLESIVEKSTKSLLESSAIAELKGRKVLAISNIANNTQDDIDVEFLSRSLARTLRKSKKITLTNAIAGSGAKTDELILDSRKLTDDERFDQYTTQERGTLLAPDLSLSGKIIERRKNVGDHVRVDYDFLFVLSDVRSGGVVWDGEWHISKLIEKTQIVKFGKLGAGSCESGDIQACAQEAQSALESGDYEKTKKLLDTACDLGSKEACENLAHVKKLIKKQRKSARPSHFGLSIGADIGAGGGGANIVDIPYSRPQNPGVPSGYIRYNGGEIAESAYPYMLQAGLWYKRKNGLYLAANALFGGFSMNLGTEYGFACTGNNYGSCAVDNIYIKGMKFKHLLFGGGARVGGAISSDDDSISLVAFVGGGALKDIGSTMTSIGNYPITRKLDNLFPFWEIGAQMVFGNVFFLETSYRHLFDGASDKSWASIGSFNLGLGFMLPIW